MGNTIRDLREFRNESIKASYELRRSEGHRSTEIIRDLSKQHQLSKSHIYYILRHV